MILILSSGATIVFAIKPAKPPERKEVRNFKTLNNVQSLEREWCLCPLFVVESGRRESSFILWIEFANFCLWSVKLLCVGKIKKNGVTFVTKKRRRRRGHKTIHNKKTFNSHRLLTDIHKLIQEKSKNRK